MVEESFVQRAKSDTLDLSSDADCALKPVDQADIEQVSLLFLVWMLGIVAALFAVLIEFAVKRHRRQTDT